MAPPFLYLQRPPQFLQGTLFDSGYIASADAGGEGDFSLALGRLAVQAIAQADDLLLLQGQAGGHCLPQLLGQFPVAHLLQQIPLFADHIHQLQGRTVCSGFDVIRKGHILRTFSLSPKVHQNLVFHTSGGISSQPRAFGRVKTADALHQTNGANGNQILLLIGLGIVFLRRLMLVGRL